MRTQSVQTGYLDFSRKSSLKVVRQYQEKYMAISRLLRDNPGVTALAHRDLEAALSESRRGRRSAYTSAQIVRALVVMFVEGESYRGVVVRVDTSEFLHHFVGLGPQGTMDYTLLCKAFRVLSEETWQAINQTLGEYARQEEKITGEKLRMDTTVYESNIHYPADSSLLWDSYRALSRTLRQVRLQLPALAFRHRCHARKARNLSLFIGRNCASPNKSKKRAVKKAYRKLIERVRRLAGVGAGVLRELDRHGYECADLSRYLPTVEKIVSQAAQRIVNGEKLPAGEKVYSLFEEHVELLKRGKAGKPIEFGHKVLVAQTREKFIHHYQVSPERIEDAPMLVPTLDAHRRLFGALPELVATDRGFYESMKQLAKLEEHIKTVSICKKGRCTETESAREMAEAFRAGQRFRAGSEGSISVLKRAFNLGLCFFKGYKNYAASVGCAIFCHNLVLLSRL